MKEIFKDISKNNKKKPSKKQIEELFEVLRQEGHATPIKKH